MQIDFVDGANVPTEEFQQAVKMAAGDGFWGPESH
jgi:hypothetical protein